MSAGPRVGERCYTRDRAGATMVTTPDGTIGYLGHRTSHKPAVRVQLLMADYRCQLVYQWRP
jgi:hypothetical protein